MFALRPAPRSGSGAGRTGAFALSVAACCGLSLFTACSDAYREISEDVREPDATIRITDFVRESVAVDGRRAWIVRAKEAFLFQNGDEMQRIVAYDFSFTQYDENNRPADLLVAERGEVDYNSDLIRLSGNVRYDSANGRRVIGESMEYDRIAQIASSDSPLTIIDRGSTVRCERGAEIDNENNRQVCRGPVILSRPVEGGRQNEVGDPLDLFQ